MQGGACLDLKPHGQDPQVDTQPGWAHEPKLAQALRLPGKRARGSPASRLVRYLPALPSRPAHGPTPTIPPRDYCTRRAPVPRA